MDKVKLSSKGQIVIPKEMRDELHLPAGTEFVISVTASGIQLTPKPLFPKSTVAEVMGILAKPGRIVADEAELKIAIKKRLKKNDEDSKE